MAHLNAQLSWIDDEDDQFPGCDTGAKPLLPTVIILDSSSEGSNQSTFDTTRFVLHILLI